MKRTNIGLLTVFVAPLLIITLTGGCFTGSTKHVTSIVDYLYPNMKDTIVIPDIPVLTLPLIVGIAFVPGNGGGDYGHGLQNSHKSSRATDSVFALSEQQKIAMMQEVADHFKKYFFVKEIKIISSTDLTPGGSFANLDQIRTMYGIDVIALLSYDQVQFTDEGLLSLTYWTIVGEYVIPGEKNDTHTMLDAVIFDINSRKMLFRAPGTAHTKGISTPINLGEQLRADSNMGFSSAVKSMIINLDEQLALFREKVKGRPTEYKIIQ
jgi:rhombotail lipoprotein